MKLRITEAKLKEMDELIPLGKTDLGDLWDMRQDWVEMKKEVERLLEEKQKLEKIELELTKAMKNIISQTKTSRAWTVDAQIAFIANSTLRKVYGDNEDKGKDTLCLD